MDEQQKYVEVEGKSDLVRETRSKAIINRNKNAYDLAIKRAKDAQEQRDELRDTTREINVLKCEMHEIKSMLKTFMENN